MTEGRFFCHLFILIRRYEAETGDKRTVPLSLVFKIKQ